MLNVAVQLWSSESAQVASLPSNGGEGARDNQ